MHKIRIKWPYYRTFRATDTPDLGPTDDDMKWAAQHMTKAQIAKAQRMAEDWTRRHRRQLPTSVDKSLDPAQLAR